MTLEDLIRIIIEKQELCRTWFGFTDDEFYTKEQLTRKYRELAKKHHADITKGTDDDMKAINEAYAWLKPFAKDPKDKKYVFYDNNLKRLKIDYENLISLLYQPYCYDNFSKTSKRLYENRKTILKQIKPIHEILKDKFQVIDVYLHNHPDNYVSKYIKNRVNNLVNANDILLGSYKYYHISNINLICRKFSSSMLDYRKDFIYHCDSVKGIKRNYMRKCRNQALVELINFTKEIQNFLLIMNNGFVEVPKDYNNKKGIINLTYIADYEKLNKCFGNIRKSGNYFCYISDDEKKVLSKNKKNKLL